MEKIQYKNTEKFTPEVIEEVLEVKQKFGLTADSLLKKASKKSSSLYEFFDWDNSSAGEKWRLHQARLLLNEVKIVIKDKELFAFENVNVSIEDIKPNKVKKGSNQREYKDVIEILNKKEYRKQVIQKALTEISFWKEKYSELKELSEIFSSIDKTKQKWQNKK